MNQRFIWAERPSGYSFLNHEHWLFWPFVFFTLQLLLYLFFFSSKGYFAYQDLKKTKAKLEKDIQEITKEKAALNEKGEILKDDQKAYQKFREKLLLVKDKRVEVLKFQDETPGLYHAHTHEDPLYQKQKIYIVIASLLQVCFVCVFFYYEFYIKQRKKEAKYP